MTMTSEQLRQAFLEYFHHQKHEIVSASSLVPATDPTLLFTNAGMVQFKDTFLGLEKRPYRRAVSVQRCVRAGGKHNDLDNVGYTARHHTFFEMLGNFSFGDYFKEKAIFYAWDFLTRLLHIPQEKLWISVYEEDKESEEIWIEKIGVSPSRVLRCAAEDNFWSMGETGPCGPCTEIYYDHGETIPGGLPGTPEASGDRYVEIWNLVFMQYERQADGSLTPLPKPSVDTGMGLERITAVMQGVHSNYETDLFKPIIEFAINKLYYQTHPIDQNADYYLGRGRFHVFADHIRSSSFLIMDGVMPSNEGRGYVLRRIIRRAIRHGYQCRMPSPFFYQLVAPLVNIMEKAYPDLKKAKPLIEKILIQEEEQFMRTLEQGIKILQETIESLEDKAIPGKIVFRLYDTYGFPPDLTADIAREKQIEIDEAGFEKEMQKQRALSQASQKFDNENIAQLARNLKTQENSVFTGYKHLQESQTRITGVLKNTQQEIEGLILDCTPFYAESGGQVGDQGVIQHQQNIFSVKDTQKVGQHIVHYGNIVQGTFKESDIVTANVDKDLRQKTALNHSATHLLHAALREILGAHVQQKGSLVTPEKLRFDFSHPALLQQEELNQIETLVNQKIRENFKAQVTETTPDKAIASGAMALFGEKYGDTVRTLKLGDFSYEVCGGTHVSYTGEIGFFKIISETGIAAGIRRIEAVTGEGAEQWIKVEKEQLLLKIQQLMENQKQLQKQLSQLHSQSARHSVTQSLQKVKEIQGIKVLIEKVEPMDNKALREMVDYLKEKFGSAIITLGCTEENKVTLIIGVTKDLMHKFPANQLIQTPATAVGGKGGGRPELAQAGGDQPQHLMQALASVEAQIRSGIAS